MKIDPQRITGNWTHGWALDRHTVSSVQGGDRDSGGAVFQTERSELGEALYELKYRGDREQLEPIAVTIAGFIRGRSELADIQAILAVPPSDTRRSFQPVDALAARIGAELGLPAPDDYIVKTRPTAALKNMADKRRRRRELEGAFTVSDQRFAGSHLLLFDDLFRSGETLKAVTVALLFDGNAAMVSVLAATGTRSNR